MKRPAVITIGAWITGENPGPMRAEVDQPLSPDDIEIDLTGLEIPAAPPIHPLDAIAVAAFRRAARR